MADFGGMAQMPGKHTILVVDDDATVLNLVRVILVGAGYDVLVANGGADAVEVYESASSRIHLLLTDVMMPDLTGPALASRLLARQPDLRVLFISGFHDSTVTHAFAGTKGCVLVAKPFTREELLGAVAGALG